LLGSSKIGLLLKGDELGDSRNGATVWSHHNVVCGNIQGMILHKSGIRNGVPLIAVLIKDVTAPQNEIQQGGYEWMYEVAFMAIFNFLKDSCVTPA
jgi:hypothetical protein